MFTHRRANERGHADHGWLHAKHTFSFADYHDPKHMGFRSLRVINEDRVEPRQGFPTHGHRDMEIVTYVIEGALEHKDSMGNGSIIRPGDIQYMSAGSGVRHSEFNSSESELVHLLQIWIEPNQRGQSPRYGQIRVEDADKLNRLRLVVSNEVLPNTIHIYQDAKVYASILDSGKSLEYRTAPDRGLWLQIVKGELQVENLTLRAGDGLAVEKRDQIQILAMQRSEFLLFDLA